MKMRSKTPVKAQKTKEFEKALTELKLIKAGKKKARNALDFLNGL